MSHEVITSWRTSLVELCALGDALARAIDADDLIAAISTMMQLRRVRSALSRIEAPAQAAIESSAELAALADVAALVATARTIEVTMDAWLSRPLPDEAALLGSPLGGAVLADAILPAVWDFETDLVVLIGDELATAATILADLGQRRVVLVGRAPVPGCVRVETAPELGSAIRTFVPNAPANLVLRSTSTADPELVAALGETAREVLGDLRIHRNTVRAFSKTWIEQGAKNLGAIARHPSVASVGDAFAGLPMVIVAPGPSLARNAHLLRELSGKALITAFSHSLKPVLAAGVVPDFVLTVDPQDVRYHFAGCDVSQSCLVNAATASPALFELPAKRFLTLSANCAIDDWLFEPLAENALVPGGGSVATSAFSLALRWGCDPIIFVGLDLSFSGGQYYVGTSSDGGARAEVDANGLMRVAGWSNEFRAMKAHGGPDANKERAIELPGWHGGTVPSSFMFGLFHRWFVERMRGAGSTTVFNCTEGGAFIDGMRHVPLAEVIAGLAGAVDPEADRRLAAVEATFDRGSRREALERHVRGYVTRLRRCRTLARRARDLIARGESGHRLERVERALATALRPLGFATLLAQREVERAHDIARRDADTATLLAASAALLAALDNVIDQLEPALTAGLATLADVEQPHAA